MRFLKTRIVEIITRVVRHAESFHDALRGDILNGGHSHDLLEVEDVEGKSRGEARSFGRIAATPVLGFEPPTDLERRGKVRLDGTFWSAMTPANDVTFFASSTHQP